MRRADRRAYQQSLQRGMEPLRHCGSIRGAEADGREMASTERLASVLRLMKSPSAVVDPMNLIERRTIGRCGTDVQSLDLRTPRARAGEQLDRAAVLALPWRAANRRSAAPSWIRATTALRVSAAEPARASSGAALGRDGRPGMRAVDRVHRGTPIEPQFQDRHLSVVTQAGGTERYASAAARRFLNSSHDDTHAVGCRRC